jgi:hypothetical protein
VPYHKPRAANPGVGVPNLVISAYQAPSPPPSIDFLDQFPPDDSLTALSNINHLTTDK